jgi:hypothetical protein
MSHTIHRFAFLNKSILNIVKDLCCTLFKGKSAHNLFNLEKVKSHILYLLIAFLLATLSTVVYSEGLNGFVYRMGPYGHYPAPGVQVLIQSQYIQRSFWTNQYGVYFFEGIPPGPYALQVYPYPNVPPLYFNVYVYPGRYMTNMRTIYIR